MRVFKDQPGLRVPRECGRVTLVASMQITSRRKAIAFFIVLGSSLVAVAIVLNITWIIHWREVVPVVLGIILFGVIIAGLILNTIFLVREIRRNEQHDSFINAVTHELKTPIASIRLYLETLQSRTLAEEQRRDFYRVMLEDTDRLMGTVEQVLRAAETVQKRGERSFAQVDVAAVMHECVEVARVRHHLGEDALAEKNHAVDAGESTVIGDAEDLRTAISNLLNNAIKYSTDEIKIQAEVLPLGGDVLIRVSDHGVGIPRADLTRIFKRFYRATRTQSKVKGTGLGLFIVRAIVKRHSGSVLAESEGEGKGATVTLRLPRYEG